MIADVPAGGPDIPGLLASIDAKLGSIDAELARIEDEEIPAVEQRAEARESRLIFWGRIATVVVVTALVAAYVLGYLAWHQSITRITRLEQANAAHVRSACITANQVRADDLAAEEVFTRYVRDTASDPGSPAVRAEAERILALFRAKDRQRPCPK